MSDVTKPTLDPPPGSVSAQIVLALRDRLLKINGQNGMVNDVQGRVFLRRVNADADLEQLPAVFLRRRLGGGTTRAQKPTTETYDTTIVYDVIGIVPAGEMTTIAGEELMADLYRALECPGDFFITALSSDGERSTNLLNQELQIVDVHIDDLLAAMPLDIVGVGVQCTYPQKYGDPNYVE